MEENPLRAIMLKKSASGSKSLGCEFLEAEESVQYTCLVGLLLLLSVLGML